MANNNRSKKSKTNLSTKSIVSKKSSSSSTITCNNYAKRHSTPKSLNSETPALPHSSASAITREDFIATVNSQDEKNTKSNQASAILGINTSWNTISKHHRDEHQRFAKPRAWQIEAVFKEVVLSYFRCRITTKTSKKAEETETKVQDLFSRELGVNKDDFDYELNKAHRLPINSAESTRHNSPPNIICKFRTHRFREQLYSQKKKIYRSTIQKTFMSTWQNILRICWRKPLAT